MKLGENIKKIRKRQGISVEKLADMLQVSVSTIYRYENSSIEKIPVHVFEKIALVLGVTTAELMGNIPVSQQELPGIFQMHRVRSNLF